MPAVSRINRSVGPALAVVLIAILVAAGAAGATSRVAPATVAAPHAHSTAARGRTARTTRHTTRSRAHVSRSRAHTTRARAHVSRSRAHATRSRRRAIHASAARAQAPLTERWGGGRVGGSATGSTAAGSGSTTTGSGSTGPGSTGSTGGSGGASSSSTPSGPQPTGESGNWNLIFNDDFNGTSLDVSTWNPNWYGTSKTLPSDGMSPTDQSCDSPSEVSESGGYLSLGVAAGTCTADSGKQYSYSGSLINTWHNFQFTYGFLEARIYVPTSSTGQLINSLSFWADGTGKWPTTGELDVLEILKNCGGSGKPGFAYHFHSTSGAPGACVPASSTGGWHTFGADWAPGKVTYYYDGKDVGSITSGITSSPMYLILSQSVNSTDASSVVDPAQALVDYVRVWQTA